MMRYYTSEGREVGGINKRVYPPPPQGPLYKGLRLLYGRGYFLTYLCSARFFMYILFHVILHTPPCISCLISILSLY